VGSRPAALTPGSFQAGKGGKKGRPRNGKSISEKKDQFSESKYRGLWDTYHQKGTISSGNDRNDSQNMMVGGRWD